MEDFSFSTTEPVAAKGDGVGAGTEVWVAHAAWPHLQHRQATVCSMKCGETLATACIQTINNPMNVAITARMDKLSGESRKVAHPIWPFSQPRRPSS